MNRLTCVLASTRHVSHWWTWVPLIPLLATGCKPRDMMCEPEAYFKVLEPEQGAGAAPFNIERPGPAVKGYMMKIVPTGVTLTGDNRARTHWLLLGHIYSYGDVIYSPAEGLARGIDDPEIVYPMRRLSNGSSTRVRLGFRAAICRDPDYAGGVPCHEYSKDEAFFVADMGCKRMRAE